MQPNSLVAVQVSYHDSEVGDVLVVIVSVSPVDAVKRWFNPCLAHCRLLNSNSACAHHLEKKVETPYKLEDLADDAVQFLDALEVAKAAKPFSPVFSGTVPDWKLASGLALFKLKWFAFANVDLQMECVQL